MSQSSTVAGAASSAVLSLGANFSPNVSASFAENPIPASAANTTTVVGTRYENAASVYFMPKFAYRSSAVHPLVFRSAALEAFDVLPAALAMTFEQAVALGRLAPTLPADDTPEVDLGSAR